MTSSNGNSTGNGNSKVGRALQVSVMADFAMIAAMVTLCVWVGRQAERIDAGVKADQEQAAAFTELQKQVTTVSGQVLQMASTTTTATNMAQAEQRLSVVETKQTASDQFTREMKSDLVSRLTRIETKIDQAR